MASVNTAAQTIGLSFAPGARVGLFGGSFNPAHEGHAHVARTGLNRLGLDQVVWLVSPQNPLKSSAETASLAERMKGARAWADDPRMTVSDAETRLGSAYSVDTVRAFKAAYPGVDFVWLMGTDSLVSLHHWKDWRGFLREIPVAVVSRPGSIFLGRNSRAARKFGDFEIPITRARRLPGMRAPAWVHLRGPLVAASSTAIRRAAKGG